MGFFVRPDEDLALLAVNVTGSAEDPEYEATNLILEDGSNPAKLTTTTGWFLFEFASKVAPESLALLFQYIDAGLPFKLQANDTDSWGSPSFEQALTAPPKRLDGPSYQRWTENIYELLDELDDEDGYLFWRLYFDTANSQPIAIGRVMLPSTRHDVTLFHDGDIPEGDDTGEINHETELGVENIEVLDGPRRSVSAPFIGTDLNAGTAPVQEAADFRALHESCEGRKHPFLFQPFSERPPWLVRFESPKSPRSHRLGGYQVWNISVKEVSRGVPWP